VAALRNGDSYIEDIPSEQLQRALARGYLPSTDLGDITGFDVAVISVPTPLRDGLPDLSYIDAAGESIARVLRAGALVILESTTYPGTTEERLGPILEEGSRLRAGRDFFLGYSPERIDPGNPAWTLTNTPKVVSGIDADSCAGVEAFYGSFVDKVVPVGSCAEAEMVKLLENTFRHVNIALVNELAMFARDLGVDIWSAIDAASTKPFGYMRFTPGPGVGGHCLPIDPSYLSWRVRRRLGQTFRFVELANDVNEHMPDYVARRVTLMLNREKRAVNGTRVLVLGLTYKAGTSDWRESPSIAVVERLLARGADLTACDPHIPDVNIVGIEVPLVPFGAEALRNAELVVVLVNHPEFDPELIARESTLVFDTKGILRGREFRGEVL
jgi:nucleotide sugar dehydrogenase